MAAMMSFVMVAVNVGFNPQFLSAWLKGGTIGFLVSIPISYFLPPLVERLLEKIGIK
jgi:hypothetical protein